jgi:6,7-dimethyl-8-ribityllumazine synthase
MTEGAETGIERDESARAGGEAAAAPPVEPPAPPADEPRPDDHAPGELEIPDGVRHYAGAPDGSGRSVGIAVSRFHADVTSRLLAGALAALEEAGVERDRVDVVQVPGAFELPLGAMALAKTRRYACVVALGCVIRGETPHFEYVASEAASGLQLASLETGVPVAFGLLTCDDRTQAEARAGGARGNKGAEAARSALEMADVFARLRSDAVVPDRR